MTAGIIVLLSLLLAGLFTLAYLLRPDIREQIEKPKFLFQNQIEQYNSQTEHMNETTTHQTDE